MRIVVPTPKTVEEYKDSQAYQSLLAIQKHLIRRSDVIYIEFIISIFAENTKGLPELYNSVLLDDASMNRVDDIIVFLHDDVEVHDIFFYDKLIIAHQKYDIVGLAGATTQRYDMDVPSVWHLSMAKPSDGRGIVNHYIPYDGGYVNSVFFGPTPATVAVIDGLMISVKRSVLEDKKVSFDETFSFHHYDISFCARATACSISIGVWPIFVIHHGLGEFNTDDWKKSDKLFKTTYLK